MPDLWLRRVFKVKIMVVFQGLSMSLLGKSAWTVRASCVVRDGSAGN